MLAPPSPDLAGSPDRRRLAWVAAQAVAFIAGIAMVLALLVSPRAGLVVVWDVLIPAAPALLVFAPGLWRNICPLGTVSQLPRHLGAGRRLRTSRAMRNGLAVGSVCLLLLLVPARHVGLDDTGLVSASALLLLGLLALAGGFLFDGKSGWCSGLCPVHAVEQLYGTRPIATFANAHCVRCVRCTPVCPDSTPAMGPLNPGLSRLQRRLGLLIVGGFPGLVWGWYQVPAGGAASDLESWAVAYATTWGAMVVSLALYLPVWSLTPPEARARVERLFAGAAVSIYYWYKLPALLGIAGSGTALLDLGDTLPAWAVWACRALTTTVLLGWMAAAPDAASRRSWLHRPRDSSRPRSASLFTPITSCARARARAGVARPS